MGYRIAEARLPLWKKWLMALAGLTLAGCSAPARPQVYSLPAFPAPSDNPMLQACAEHAATNMRMSLPDRFKMLKLENNATTLEATQNFFVGSQPAARVLDGRGLAYFNRETRLVRFHCVMDDKGAPLYSFLRPE